MRALSFVVGVAALCAGCDDPPDAVDRVYQWHTFYGNADGYDVGNSLVVGGDGNVYVAGLSQGTWNGPDGQGPLNPYADGWSTAFVLKMSLDGAYQWHTYYGASGASGDVRGYAIAVDGSGDVYVTGSATESWNGPDGQPPLHALGTSEAGDTPDLFILKLSASGVYQWHAFYGGDDDDYGYSVAVDGSGNIYVAGASRAPWDGPDGQVPLHAFTGWDDTSYNPQDAFVLKLDASGAYQWHTFYGSDLEDTGTSLDVDGVGNVYVAGWGSSWDGPDGQSSLDGHSPTFEDSYVLKLDTSGAYQWHRFLGGGLYDSRVSIAVDGSGNVHVAGGAGESVDGPDGQGPLHAHSGGVDLCVHKLDADGAYQWHTYYGGFHVQGDRAIGVDGSGNVYVTAGAGDSYRGPGGESPLHAHAGGVDSEGGHLSDIVVVKLDASGAYRWHSFYGSRESDHGFALDVDESGGVYATGASDDSWKGPAGVEPLNPFPGYLDAFVLKLAE